MEQRASKSGIEVRTGPTGAPMLTGYAAVFNRPSEDLGGFIEFVDPSAFTKTLQEADVRCLINHDPDQLIGRTKSGTMRLTVDGTGLRYEVDIDPSDPDGQRALQKVKRGDLDGSSFSFRCISDQWNYDTQPAERRLMEVALIDCAPVTFPAYPDASVAARALERVARKVGHTPEELATALAAGEIRSLVMADEPNTPAVAPVNILDEIEDRAGKKLSAASVEYLMDVMHAIRDFISGATEPDGDPADGVTTTDDGDGDAPGDMKRSEEITPETAAMLASVHQRAADYDREWDEFRRWCESA